MKLIARDFDFQAGEIDKPRRRKDKTVIHSKKKTASKVLKNELVEYLESSCLKMSLNFLKKVTVAVKNFQYHYNGLFLTKEQNCNWVKL